MRIFMMSDTHGAQGSVLRLRKAAAESHIDVLVHAGDFAHFGRFGDPIFEAAKDLGLRTVFAGGNHETPELDIHAAVRFGASCIDYATATIDEVLFVGIPGWDILFQQDRRRNLRNLEKLRLPAARAAVLVTHAPPSPWMVNGRDAGCSLAAEYAAGHHFRLIATGHIHEAKPRYERASNGAVVINPGPEGAFYDLEPGG